MIQWILVRHGAHIDQRLSGPGEAQVKRLREALVRRGVEPTLYLRSQKPQARWTHIRLAETLNARAVESRALTPRDQRSGLDALVEDADSDLADAPTVILIGHEGRLSNLLTELTSTRRRPFPEAGAVCVSGKSVTDLLLGKGKVEFAVPTVDHQEMQLRGKVTSKMTVATLLAGFVLTALVAVVLEGPDPADRRFEHDLTIVAFATALAFFVAAIYVYDQLAMPEGFWTDGSRSPWRKWLARRATRRRERRWEKLRTRSNPSGRLLRWRARQARLAEHGPVFPTMVEAWTWLFTPGVVAALVGFGGLLWNATRWVHALSIAGVFAATAAYAHRRPDLGAD